MSRSLPLVALVLLALAPLGCMSDHPCTRCGATLIIHKPASITTAPQIVQVNPLLAPSALAPIETGINPKEQSLVAPPVAPIVPAPSTTHSITPRGGVGSAISLPPVRRSVQAGGCQDPCQE